MRNEYKQLALEGVALPVGGTMRTNCPFCGGGKRDLALYRNVDGLFFKCFSGCCGKWGKLEGVSGSIAYQTTPPPPTKRPQWLDDMVPGCLPDSVLAELQHKYSLMEGILIINSVKYDKMTDCILMPTTWEQQKTGVVVKYLHPSDGRKKTKSYYYGDTRISTAKRGPFRSITTLPCVVVVEDMISCLRLAQEGVQAVSLNGSSISTRDVVKLATLYPKIVIALDNDSAGRIGGKLMLTYSSLFKSTTQMYIPCDIKDMSQEVLTEFLTRISKCI